MPMTEAQIRQAIDEARASLSGGKMARADLICQSILAQGTRHREITFIEGRVAAAIGEFAIARRCFQEMLAANSADAFAEEGLREVDRLEGERNDLSLATIRPPHPLASMEPVKAASVEAAYRYLIRRYLKPRCEITAAVEAFAARHFDGRTLLAVHVRGSDKVTEKPNLAEGHRALFEEVKKELNTTPGLWIFLMTDDAQVRDQYLSAFPDRVITTDCARSSSTRGVHYCAGPSRTQLGIEILVDAYLAARCYRLLGIGYTNVSNFILHLKEWPAGSVRLLGAVMHYQRNLLLHA